MEQKLAGEAKTRNGEPLERIWLFYVHLVSSTASPIFLSEIGLVFHHRDRQHVLSRALQRVFVTTLSQEVSQKISQHLLVACVNAIEKVRSMYWWNGKDYWWARHFALKIRVSTSSLSRS